MKTPEDFYNEFECNKKSEILDAIKSYADYLLSIKLSEALSTLAVLKINNMCSVSGDEMIEKALQFYLNKEEQ